MSKGSKSRITDKRRFDRNYDEIKWKKKERKAKKMKLWLISQNAIDGYDTYDSAVVAADTETEAKMMHPGTGEDIKPKPFPDWVCEPELVACEYIGEAKDGTQKGVICSRFNAG